MKEKEISVSAPGRLCLLGEHQDYFGLSIIAAAINLRISISGKKRRDGMFHIDLPDIGRTEEFSIEKEQAYNQKRDYLKSAVNILKRVGVPLTSGWDCTVKGSIPINSGTASSSALVVAWIKFLLESSRDKRAEMAEAIAELAFSAEVAEFKEPGGKMDHYASSLGNVISINFAAPMKVEKFKNPLKTFVLADSLIKKETTNTLGFIKSHVLQGVSIIQKKINSFNLNSPIGPREKEEIKKLPDKERRLISGTLMTRDITAEGKRLFLSDEFEHKHFGHLLSKQQDVLRDYLQVSVSKIDKMIDASLEAGALGAKINGSGEGGCIFAYTPKKSEEVAEAFKKLDTKVYIVHIDEGARKDK